MHYTNKRKVCVCRCGNPARNHSNPYLVYNSDVKILVNRYFELHGGIDCTKNEWRMMSTGEYFVTTPSRSAPVPASHGANYGPPGFSSYTSHYRSRPPSFYPPAPASWDGPALRTHAKMDYVPYVSQPARPTQPQPARPTQPQPARPTQPQPARPTEPQPARPTEPQPARPTEPSVTDQCVQGTGPSTSATNSRPTMPDSPRRETQTNEPVISPAPRSSYSQPTQSLSDLEALMGRRSVLFGNAWSEEVGHSPSFTEVADTPAHVVKAEPGSAPPARVGSTNTLTGSIAILEEKVGPLSFNPWEYGENEIAARHQHSLPVVLEENDNGVSYMPDTIPSKSMPIGQSVSKDDVSEVVCRAGSSADTRVRVDPSVSSLSRRVDQIQQQGAPSSVPKKNGISKLVAENNEQAVPDQEAFFENHVTVCTLRNPPRSGASCKLCREPFNSYVNKRTIRLSACQHHFHHQCLLKWMRQEDLAVVRCPTCSTTLFERTLNNRIVADKEAIFGAKFTKLRSEVKLDFDDLYVICRSEEQLAATQLRILKNYINHAMDEAWSRLSKDDRNLDWYGVIRVALDKLKASGMLLVSCCYVSSQDAFLKFVMWAELARLVNRMKAAYTKESGSEGSPFPSLAQLHKTFVRAMQQYDKEKETWAKDRDGALPCELIAHDVYQACLKSFPSHER